MTDKAVVFDKAAWHLESVRSHDLPDEQASIHSGLFFGWAVRRGLTQRWLEDRTPDAFARFRAGEIGGPALLRAWDGAVLDDMFTDEGLAFVAEYFDLRSGAFLGDYVRTLADGLPSEFHVEDTAENARRLDEVLDRRFAEWRATWGGDRPDLRIGLEDVGAEPLPAVLVAPVMAVTSGVPLPSTPLGVRASRPGSLGAVERALAGERRIVLLPLASPGRKSDPGPADLSDHGVVADVRSATRAEDRPGSKDVLLQCLARVEVRGWREGLTAEVAVLPEPEPTAEDVLKLEEVRLTAADVVRRRGERGEPPGLLALAAAMHGAALLDVVAGELVLTREERLTVLEAPDLATRAEVVLTALSREP
jgi:Lon protease-like protein